MLKSMRKSKNRYFYHIFVSAGDAPGVITLNLYGWKENSLLTNCLAACAHLAIVAVNRVRTTSRFLVTPSSLLTVKNIQQ